MNDLFWSPLLWMVAMTLFPSISSRRFGQISTHFGQFEFSFATRELYDEYIRGLRTKRKFGGEASVMSKENQAVIPQPFINLLDTI
jgi:hypothetical protein